MDTLNDWNDRMIREHSQMTNALTSCNACEAEQMHDNCHMGYCQDCCPAGGDH